ncbi:VOC family protein [Phyllobacterium sp. 22229]|uniref:VOC family protein n=1 Tax=Agrobacterium radiobacter TaxID=362 RepID=A0ABD5LPT8_AGRRD
MLLFDHISVIAPSLEEGIEHVSSCLGIELINGASHNDMGTHNRHVRLGEDCYLEVIAVDPAAPPPSGRRWFGLDDTEEVRATWEQGLRLRGWVARTHDIDGILNAHGPVLGEKRWLDGHFNFSVPASGKLPMDGTMPSIIDLGGAPPTATNLTDQGMRLKEFVLEHPYPSEIVALYNDIGIVNPPIVIAGKTCRFHAVIETPRGLTTLH